eukprot:8510482-Lingulodinium_polyedra.AAC.1
MSYASCSNEAHSCHQTLMASSDQLRLAYKTIAASESSRPVLLMLFISTAESKANIVAMRSDATTALPNAFPPKNVEENIGLPLDELGQIWMAGGEP